MFLAIGLFADVQELRLITGDGLFGIEKPHLAFHSYLFALWNCLFVLVFRFDVLVAVQFNSECPLVELAVDCLL